MRIYQDHVYRVYKGDQSPESLFRKARSYLEKAQTAATQSNGASAALLQGETEHMMIHAIFGSNRIEFAGLGFQDTKDLCERILREEADARTERPDNVIDAAHAGHLYMLQKWAIDGEPMTEALIRRTHRILCQDIPVLHRAGPETPVAAYAGLYRTVIVGAGNTNFVVPGSVPRRMAQLCGDLGAELGAAVDPFALAAKCSLEFVQIHPFLDGNGRMCRLLLNAILFRCVGVLVAVGADDADADEYMGIKKRRRRRWRAMESMRRFVLARSVKSLRRLKQKLTGKRE